jgi:hypothetical protein
MPPKEKELRFQYETSLRADEFYQHTNAQILTVLQFPPYEIKDSIQSWIHDFADEVDSIGINNMDDCCPHIRRFMP